MNTRATPPGENISFIYNNRTYTNYAVAGSAIKFDSSNLPFADAKPQMYGFLMEPGSSLARGSHRSDLNDNFFRDEDQRTKVESLIYGTEVWLSTGIYAKEAWRRVLTSILHVAILQEVYGIEITNYMTASETGINDMDFLSKWLGRIYESAQLYNPTASSIGSATDKINIFILDPEGLNRDVLVYTRTQDPNIPVIPVPGAMLLFSTGLGALAVLRRRTA